MSVKKICDVEVAGSNVDILGQFKTLPESFQRSVPRRKILKLFMCLCVYNSCRKFNLATFNLCSPAISSSVRGRIENVGGIKYLLSIALDTYCISDYGRVISRLYMIYYLLSVPGHRIILVCGSSIAKSRKWQYSDSVQRRENASREEMLAYSGFANFAGRNAKVFVAVFFIYSYIFLL
jgi:hypothetical protein